MRTVLPAGELLHPVPLLAVAVLALNDHVLKGSGLLPGWLTGKLSDITGLFFFPLLLTALVRTLVFVVTRRRIPLSPWLLGGAIGITALGFAAIQLSPAVVEVFERWSPRLDPTGAVGAVEVTMDPTDLMALPVMVGTWWHGRRVAARESQLMRKASQTRQST